MLNDSHNISNDSHENMIYSFLEYIRCHLSTM